MFSTLFSLVQDVLVTNPPSLLVQVTNRYRIAMLYFRSWFLIDVLAALPCADRWINWTMEGR